MSKDECIKRISKLTDKRYIRFTTRGNTAIEIVLKLIRNKKKVCIQDQGGWLTYPQFIKKQGLEQIDLPTDHGIVHPDDVHPNSILLINSMPAYSFLQDMKKMLEVCREKNTIVVNDTSGSIGTDDAMHGDIILGSFGNAKPLELKEGGFIACSQPEAIYGIPDADIDFKGLLKVLKQLPSKLKAFQTLHKKIVIDLKKYDIILPSPGINVIVRYKEEAEKAKLEAYAKRNKYKYTLCPRYIRVLEKAVCFEIKRGENDDA